MTTIIGIRHWTSVGLLMLSSAVCWAQKPELVVQTGHSAFVVSLTFSPDGKILASAGADNTIKLWEANTGRQLRTWSSADCISLAFSANGKLLASGSVNGSIKLWDVDAGQELRELTGHSSRVNSIGFSHDGTTLATANADGTIGLWEVATGRELHILRGHSGAVNSVDFDPSRLVVASGGSDQKVKVWDVSTGQELGTLTGHSAMISEVKFSADGRSLASGGIDGIKLWDVASRKELRPLGGGSSYITSVAFSADGRTLISDSLDGTIRLCDVDTGRESRTFKGHSNLLTSIEKMIRSVPTTSEAEMLKFLTDVVAPMLTGHSALVISTAFSADGKILASGSMDYTIKLSDVETGTELRSLTGHSAPVSQVALSADGRMLARGSFDYTVKLWDLTTVSPLRTLTGHSGLIVRLAFSSDGKTLASAGMDMTIKLWDVATGRELHTLGGFLPFAFSADGKTFASGGAFDGKKLDGKSFGSRTIEMWDVATGQNLRTLSGHSAPVRSIDFSADGKTLASGGDDKSIKLWEVATGRELTTLNGHSGSVKSVDFSRDGKKLDSVSSDKTIKTWEVATGREALSINVDVEDALSPDRQTVANIDHNAIRLSQVATGRELHQLTGHSADIASVAFSADGQYLISGGVDATIKLWRVESGELMMSLVALDETDWAVVAPDGRYDASPGAGKLMHWMVGSEPIELEQLKHRYYAPGLLAKTLKGERPAVVSAFKDLKLFPDVTYQAPAPGTTQLRIRLTNRGGGIGRVTVLVNGKEVTSDARGPRPAPQAAKGEVTVDLAGAALKPGQPNDIRVLAYNAEGWLSSRGPVVEWTAPGSVAKDPPELYAIVGGISAYSTESVNLRYAAKDAEDMAKALRIGARNLFGADKTHITVLSTSGSAGTIRPSKENFRKAFEQARKAKPGDVLVVYLSGHGMALKLSGDDDTYCYLTEEWRGGTKLIDEAVRREQSITSDELVEWINQIPALKQIMMLDTCAAGAAAEKFKLIDSRSPSPDQVRAIDRLKDRTGFHVLMGAAADKLSYETSQYSQGLLTYALLEGMKYGAVKNEIVEVSALFQYARDEVPRLARAIGIGVQQPQIMAPKADSFPVARFSSKDGDEIYLAKAKPLLLRPRIFNPDDAGDEELEKAVRRQLRETSEPVPRGPASSEPALVYLDDGDLPTAVRPSGTFTVEGDRMKVNMTLKRGEQRATFDIEGSRADIAGLSVKIVEHIAEAMKAFR